MRFTKEVNIYAGGALKKFQALEAEFKVTKKGISSLISESELRELQSGSKTMYSRMASAEQTISGLSQEYTDISSKYGTISGQYTEAKLANTKLKWIIFQLLCRNCQTTSKRITVLRTQ